MRTPAKALAVVIAAALVLIFGACATGDGAAPPHMVADAAPPGLVYASAVKASAPGYAGYMEPQASLPGWSALPAGEFNTEEYDRIVDNPFLKATDNPVSTFSIDVDTASYANMRRYLMDEDSLPPKDAVRIEEMINYFSYEYPEPEGSAPVAAHFAMAPAPWAPEHQLLRVSLKAKTVETESLPPSNLVFLLDTSGSMSDENKLPLLKESLKILVGNLRPEDRVSIVAYAGSTGLILDSVSGSRKETIIAAFDRLQASGSTAGGAGIVLAYEVAKRNFIRGGNNRVILCTDGDFNVGVSSTGELERLVEEKRKDNIYLTVIGLGTGNYKDSRMETLADKGNGNYAYVDNLLEGKKVLGKEIWGNLYAVAKDVKIQVEFNPAKVKEYRLIGYENRLLAREDFNDDTKDAGEMGSGQTVTAFYELVPVTAESATGVPAADPLVFQKPELIPSEDTLVFRLRYKEPDDGNEESRLIETRVRENDVAGSFAGSGDDFRFAAAVIEFGMLLRDSPYKGSASWQTVMANARAAKGLDAEGYRAEFVRLAELAELLEKD